MQPDRPDTTAYQSAELAAKSLLKRLDRDARYRPFFDLSVKDGVMTANHASWDCVDMSSRFTDAWILARQMFDWPVTEEELAVKRYLLATQSPDGLFYDQSLDSPSLPETADMFCQSRAIMALTTWFLETGDPSIEERIERLIAGLWNIAAKQEDFCYYLGHRYSPKGWTGVSAYDAKDLGPTALPAYGVLQVLPLMRYWESTESPAAMRLARALVHFFVRESGVVEVDGRFRGHLHSWGILPSTAGVLCYAMAAGDDTLIEWCAGVWNFIVANSSSFGWVPDGIGYDDGILSGETCCCTDLIHLGIKLAECGHERCLDFVELMIRNQVPENQVRDTSGFRFASPEVEAMTLGAFDSWVMPNGLTGCSELGLEGCCTASAVRAFYLAWSHAVETVGREVRVNLMMSRRSERVDVMSYQPWEGRLSVLAHKDCDLLIRIPGWMDGADVDVSVGGSSQPARPDGSYLRLDGVSAGTRINITFPIPERQTSEAIRGTDYRLSWRGPTLMTIDPPGSIYPIFRRTLDSMRPQSAFPLARTNAEPKVTW